MRDLKIYVGISSVLLIIYLIAQYNKPTPVDWSPTYSREDKIPYGTYILHQRIKDIAPESNVLIRRKPPFSVLKEEHIANGNYLIIAGTVNLDRLDFNELVRYMKAGNNVFIATYYLGDFLSDTLKTRISSEMKIRSELTELRFTNPALNPNRVYRFSRDIGNQYFSRFDTSRAIVLGKNSKGNSNFLKYSYGKGALYLLASPQFFTNYNMITPAGSEYAAKALSYLNPKGDLVWDELSALGPEQPESELQVLLRYQELRWAYYITLFGLITFVLFDIKRRQRVIPTIEVLKNTSLDFAQVVADLYYQRRDHKNIGMKKINYLLEDVRSKYRLNTSTLNEEFVVSLSRKTEIQLEDIRELISTINKYIAASTATDQMLIDLDKQIETFYRKIA